MNMRAIAITWSVTLSCIAIFGVLTACAPKTATRDKQEPETEQGTNMIEIDTASKGESDAATASEQPRQEDLLIKDQTFQVSLKPLGDVTFASYEPDTEKNPLADASFQLQRDGQVICTLDGIFLDNSRSNEMFNKVEAVSFPDYNNDGYNDIIIICNYSPASGPEAGTGYSEARIYSGHANGSFMLERDLSEAANSALAEKTVKSVLGFLGAGQKMPADTSSEWKQAYIEHLQAQDTAQWAGYTLIYVNDDEIPELVEIGDCEAAGCKIVSYANGSVDETQLNRLYFTYIERGSLLCNSEGNMDNYYDLVYRMEDGRLRLIAAGNYGAADNSRVTFDENGEPFYQYQWNEVSVSQDEYDQALNAVYNTAKAKQGYEWNEWLSRDDVIQAIYNHQ